MRARLPGQMVVHEVPALEPDAGFDGYFLRTEPAAVVEAVCRCARGLHWALPWGGEELCRRGCFREEKSAARRVNDAPIPQEDDDYDPRAVWIEDDSVPGPPEGGWNE